MTSEPARSAPLTGVPAFVTLTQEEVDALCTYEPDVLPPGLVSDHQADSVGAGTRSLLARGLLPPNEGDPHPLGQLFAAYLASDRSLLVCDWNLEDYTIRSLNVGDSIGVAHIGRPDHLHSFGWVDPDTWPVLLVDVAIEGLADLVSDEKDEERSFASLEAELTAFRTVTGVRRIGGGHIVVDVTIAATDTLWLVDTANETAHRTQLTSIRKLLRPLIEGE
jgi:hypothetical protein